MTPEELLKFKRQISQKEAIVRLTETPDGELLLEYLGDLLLWDVGSFCQNIYESYYREGRRSVLINLLSLKDMDMKKYMSEVKKIQIKRINEEENIWTE